MKIQKKQAIGENLLYVMVWTAIILVPVLNSQMMSEMHVNLENVLTAWRYIAPYLIIFLIHNAIIAPRYMLRRKYGKYLASNLALIISVFWLVQIYEDHLTDHLLKQNDPEALDAKREMQIAAFYGGIAITCSGTTAVHALSYPLGGKYHIAHGVSNAILLMPVMRFNEPAIRHKLALAYDRAVHGEKTCVTDEEKSAWIIERMGEIVKHLDIPTNLSQWNVSRDDLEPLVEVGMSVQRLLVNNMRTVTPEDARNIYLQIL